MLKKKEKKKKTVDTPVAVHAFFWGSLFSNVFVIPEEIIFFTKFVQYFRFPGDYGQCKFHLDSLQP